MVDVTLIPQRLISTYCYPQAIRLVCSFSKYIFRANAITLSGVIHFSIIVSVLCSVYVVFKYECVYNITCTGEFGLGWCYRQVISLSVIHIPDYLTYNVFNKFAKNTLRTIHVNHKTLNLNWYLEANIPLYLKVVILILK